MTEQKTTNVVPFGKYKGQPIEVLAQDRPYLDWLTAQDWFRERYSGIYTLIVNNFTEPAETPDHNALQVLFLEDAFCAQFVTVLEPQWLSESLRQIRDRNNDARRGILDRLNQTWTPKTEKTKLAADLVKPLHVDWTVKFERQFEQHGCDVILNGLLRTTDRSGGYFLYNSIIEIKPTVSDDYPAILRQMHTMRRVVGGGRLILFTERYAGVGATEAQFIKTFATSGIKVIFRRDVEAAPLAELSGCVRLPSSSEIEATGEVSPTGRSP